MAAADRNLPRQSGSPPAHRHPSPTSPFCGLEVCWFFVSCRHGREGEGLLRSLQPWQKPFRRLDHWLSCSKRLVAYDEGAPIGARLRKMNQISEFKGTERRGNSAEEAHIGARSGTFFGPGGARPVGRASEHVLLTFSKVKNDRSA